MKRVVLCLVLASCAHAPSSQPAPALSPPKQGGGIPTCGSAPAPPDLSAVRALIHSCEDIHSDEHKPILKIRAVPPTGRRVVFVLRRGEGIPTRMTFEFDDVLRWARPEGEESPWDEESPAQKPRAKAAASGSAPKVIGGLFGPNDYLRDAAIRVRDAMGTADEIVLENSAQNFPHGNLSDLIDRLLPEGRFVIIKNNKTVDRILRIPVDTGCGSCGLCMASDHYYFTSECEPLLGYPAP